MEDVINLKRLQNAYSKLIKRLERVRQKSMLFATLSMR